VRFHRRVSHITIAQAPGGDDAQATLCSWFEFGHDLLIAKGVFDDISDTKAKCRRVCWNNACFLYRGVRFLKKAFKEVPMAPALDAVMSS
jgi:hypothetical protein